MNELNPDSKKIYLPIEHQERELDAKILFSLFAAEYGYETVLGYKETLRQQHGDFPQGVWIQHNARGRGKSLEYFWYKRLGLSMVVLDEEALIRQTDNLFLRKHVPGVFNYIDRVFAWGESDRDFWLQSDIVSAEKLAVTGNPRADLLRPELLNYYEKKVSEIRGRCGKYVLINSNFPTVNNAMGEFHKFNISDKRNFDATEDEMKGFLNHKRNVFDRFVDLIPELAAAVQPNLLVIRPHPSEDRSVWDERARSIANVEVVLEGGVAPWIIASSVLVHNNCTTAVEAALLKKPVASYMPVSSDRFDNKFCNSMGTMCFDEKQLFSFVNRVLNGEYPNDISRNEILSHHVNVDEKKFACEYMLDEIDRLSESGLISRKAGKIEIGLRNIIVDTAKFLRKNKKKKGVRSLYLRRKISDIETTEIVSRMESFKSCLGKFHDVECADVGRDLFMIRKQTCAE